MSEGYRLHEAWDLDDFPLTNRTVADGELADRLKDLNDAAPPGFQYVLVPGGENGETVIELLEYMGDVE